MNRSETTERLEAVRKAVASVPGGATLIDVAVQLSVPAAQRNIQRWLGMLVEQNEIVRIGGSHQSRYKVRDGGEAEKPPAVSVVGQAIWRLVNQPMIERALSEYHRMWLDSYRPNQTYFIPESARTRLRAAPAPRAGAGAALSWRDPAVFQRIASDLAWQSGWLEAQETEPPSACGTLPEVTAWLTQPEAMNVRREVQLGWNHRAALSVLLNRAPNVTLSYEVLSAVYTALTKRLAGSTVVRALRGPAVVAATPNLLRMEAIAWPRTVYHPPGERWVIETCCNQILGWAPVIADPIEQAFFVFVHLVYLQPFAMLNMAMACLAVNIPLLRAGLPPLTFASVRGADLLDGIRGVWELNRTELLRDLFIAAYDDCRARYV